MKRLISILLVLVMLIAFCIPVIAATTELGSGNYDNMTAGAGTTVCIRGDAVISDEGILRFENRSGFDISSNSSLTGNNVFLFFFGDGHRVHIAKGGKIDVSFYSSAEAEVFSDILKNSNVSCRRIGSRIIAPCSHENTAATVICKDCGETISAGGSASILSEGNMTIVCTVAAAVVFGLGGFLLGRKKKPATSNSMAGEDEE